MSLLLLLLLLKGKKINNFIKTTYTPRDYAIWDQQDNTIFQHTETIDITINKQTDSSIKTPLSTPIPEAYEI